MKKVLTVYMPVFIIIFAFSFGTHILLATENNTANKKTPNILSFGSTVESIILTDIGGREIQCPVESKVNVLIFFNIQHSAHQRTIFKIDKIYKRLSKQGHPIQFIGISQGKQNHFMKAAKQFDLKLNLINDENNILHTHYSFTCDRCIRVLITDRTQKLRYDATYINLNMIEEITLRYCAQLPDKEN
jgi:hypothetical protein